MGSRLHLEWSASLLPPKWLHERKDPKKVEIFEPANNETRLAAPLRMGMLPVGRLLSGRLLVVMRLEDCSFRLYLHLTLARYMLARPEMSA
jgi:hypothetical protein